MNKPEEDVPALLRGEPALPPEGPSPIHMPIHMPILGDGAPDATRPFGVYVYRVEQIEQHPTADNLTLVTLQGHAERLVANKLEDGSFRYATGDLAILLPVGAVLPMWLLEDMDATRVNSKGKTVGVLGGNKGNRIVPRTFADTPSNGMLCKVGPPSGVVSGNRPYGEIPRGGDRPDTLVVTEGDDVAGFLGVIEHVG